MKQDENYDKKKAERKAKLAYYLGQEFGKGNNEVSEAQIARDKKWTANPKNSTMFMEIKCELEADGTIIEEARTAQGSRTWRYVELQNRVKTPLV